MMTVSSSSRTSTMMSSRRRCFPVLSTSVLLIVFAIVLCSTNLFMASWLPVVAPPLWAPSSDHHHHPQLPRHRHRHRQKEGALVQEPVVAVIGTTMQQQQHDEEEEDNHHHHHNLIHIVSTRFMQYQSHLFTLGEARLKLFETFCLPSMLGQSVDNFIWIILTDPDLHPQLMERLKTLLSPYPNFYLVLSNNNTLPQFPNFDALHHTILTGDLDWLHSMLWSSDHHQHRNRNRHGHHQNRNHHPPPPRQQLFLQTRVDADDALSRQALEQIQDKAKELPTDTTGWQVICVKLHFEWRNDEIVLSRSRSAAATNNNNNNNTNDHHHNNTTTTIIDTAGKIRVVQERICVTPGYTLVKHQKEEEDPPVTTTTAIMDNNNKTATITTTTPFQHQIPSLPHVGHHLIVIEWPECQIPPLNATTNCWTKLLAYPAALRSRTITSAGMSRIEPNPNDSKYDDNTQLFWSYVQRDYGISPQHVQDTSQYLQDHFSDIVADNLKGQCSEGHSCKKSSKEKLVSFLNNNITVP